MIYYILIIWNVITLSMMGIDKLKAMHDRWRIPERTLLLSALAFGSFGALIGMRIFRHKTRHNAFRIGIPLMAIVHTIVFTYFYIAK